MKRLIAQEEHEEEYDNLLDTPESLAEADDKVGDVIYLRDYWDVADRERPLIYFDGKVYWGEPGESHAKLFFKEDGNSELFTKDEFYRLEEDEETELKKHKIMSGQYSDGVVLLGDNFMLCNCTFDEVHKALKSSPYPINKIYDCLDEYDLKYQRAAKILNKFDDVKKFKRVK